MEILSQLIDYLPIIGRTLLMYLIIISLLRIYGQKQIADLNLQDFVLVLLIAETSQHAWWGRTPRSWAEWFPCSRRSPPTRS